jgi:NTP pyrophosphatase (non-canonical NTP hydrolase)
MSFDPAPLLAFQDESTTIGTVRAAVRDFVEARDWQQYHTPKHLAMSIAIEAAEIMEHFQWFDAEESTERMADEGRRAEVADELADVMIYCLSLANSLDIDASAAIGKKLVRNESRFPVPLVQGRLG